MIVSRGDKEIERRGYEGLRKNLDDGKYQEIHTVPITTPDVINQDLFSVQQSLQTLPVEGEFKYLQSGISQ